MRVLVYGGRFYDDRPRVYYTLDRIHQVRAITCLIDGECHLGGADQLGHEWALSRGVPTERYRVDTALDGDWPAAGNVRNGRMLRLSHPDLGAGFPGDRGSRNMQRRLEEAGVRNIRIKPCPRT